jgi:hypothetical protein
MPYIFLKNIYHTHDSKRCLILYIIGPFFEKSNTHTNQQIAIAIAQTFHNKGYKVDVVQYNSKLKLDFDKYDVVFGFGKQFDDFLADDRRHPYESKIRTIALLTGASPYYSNLAELNRLAYVKKTSAYVRWTYGFSSAPKGFGGSLYGE